jgi:hypothetical protein
MEKLMAAHSAHGMSAQGRIMSCPDSVNMGSYGEDESSSASEKGTAVHEMIEFAFSFGLQALDLKGMYFNKYKVNGPMMDAAQECLDVLYKFSSIKTVTSHIEKRVVLSSIDKDLLWGTSDYIGVDLVNRVLYVGDYKNGFVWVEVNGKQEIYGMDSLNGNAQLAGYSIGALDTFELWDKVDHVVTFIVQPNKDHVDGTVRSETYNMSEIRSWHEAYSYTHSLAKVKNAPRKSGKHCKYCKARGFCGTRITDQMNLLKLDSSIELASPEHLIAIFEDADVMIKSIEAIKDRVQFLARSGLKIPGHKLVKGIARAIIEDEQGFIDEALKNGANEDDLYNKKLKGKTAIKPFVGNELAHKYYKTPTVGLTLVGTSDTRVAQRPDKLTNAVGVFGSVKL